MNNRPSVRILLAGATGATGQKVLTELIARDQVQSITVLARNPQHLTNEKITDQIVDFSALKDKKFDRPFDIAICCLGTTLKKAGSREKFKEVDVDFIENFALMAKINGVSRFLLMSSVGADIASKNFYLKCKGETELRIKNINFSSTTVFRPGLLLDRQKDFRFGEVVMSPLARLIAPFLLGKFQQYRAIDVSTLAKNIVNFSLDEFEGFRILTFRDFK